LLSKIQKIDDNSVNREAKFIHKKTVSALRKVGFRHGKDGNTSGNSYELEICSI